MSDRMEHQPGGGRDEADQGERARAAAEAEAMRQLHHELASAPAIDLIAQAVTHLATFAYVRLGIPPQENLRYRDLGVARVLIDALGGLLGAVQGRLGPGEEELHQALAALRMTYASVASQEGAGAAAGGPSGAEGPGEPGGAGGEPRREEPRLHRPPSGLWVPGQD